MPSGVEFSGLIAAIYDAGLGTRDWPDVLQEMAEAFGAVSANLAILPTTPGNSAGVVAVGIDDTAVETYAQHYYRLNPVTSALPRVPIGTPFTDAMIAPRQSTLRGEFFQRLGATK